MPSAERLSENLSEAHKNALALSELLEELPDIDRLVSQLKRACEKAEQLKRLESDR